jgi:hypothetical protein
VPLAERLLEVPQELIRTALELELADGTVIPDTVGDKRCVFLAGLYRAERSIAERLLQLGTGKLPWPWIDPDKAIPWIEQRTDAKYGCPAGGRGRRPIALGRPRPGARRRSQDPTARQYRAGQFSDRRTSPSDATGNVRASLRKQQGTGADADEAWRRFAFEDET